MYLFCTAECKNFLAECHTEAFETKQAFLEWRKVSKLLKKGERNRFAPLDVMSTKTSKWEEASKKILYARTGPANLD